MTNVRDVLYLLDLDGTPLRSIADKRELAIDHVLDESSMLTVTLNIDEKIIPEQQLIYRGNRYVIIDIDVYRNSKRQVITAEISYLSLSDTVLDLEIKSSKLEVIASKALEDTGWSITYVHPNSDNHSIDVEGESSLSILRFLSNISDLRLSFDTLNSEVSFVEDSGENHGLLFRYSRNLEDITKRTIAPKATTIIPYGKDGLTIESVNSGVNYVENYSWYESLGYTESEARDLFKKTHILTDDRFIYAGNLMREAEKKLELLSQPQIAYTTEVSYLDKEVSIGDYAYVVDDELGVKVNVQVVRFNEKENLEDSEIELNYLIPGLSDLSTSSTSTSGQGITTVLVDNARAVNIGNSYESVILLDITATAPTHASANISIVGELSGNGILEGMIDLNGNSIPYRYKETVSSGYKTVNFSFIVTQIQEGTHTLRVMFKFDNGTYSIDTRDAHLYVQSESISGGTSTSVPVIDVVEEVEFNTVFKVTDSVDIVLTEGDD